MNEKNNFALVRKPSSAVEKAGPGAKRILSGIVADALALMSNEEADVLYQKAHAYRSIKPFTNANEYKYRKLINQAAIKGHIEATFEVGMFYMNGPEYGYPGDMGQAYYWLHRAAERGHAEAQIYMGFKKGGFKEFFYQIFPKHING